MKINWKFYFATVWSGFTLLAINWDFGYEYSITICNLVFGIEKISK